MYQFLPTLTVVILLCIAPFLRYFRFSAEKNIAFSHPLLFHPKIGELPLDVDCYLACWSGEVL